MADANIFQGAIFHDSASVDVNRIDGTETDGQMSNGENSMVPIETNRRPTDSTPKPAVHRVLYDFFYADIKSCNVQRMPFM